LRAAWYVAKGALPILQHGSLNFPSQTVLVLKYILNDFGEIYNYYGYANVGQNVALMLSAVALWLAQNSQNEYEYNLTL
jgi:hypothetical protein